MAAKVARGLKGFKKAQKENKIGWHVFVGDVHTGYQDLSFKQIMDVESDYLILIGITGNGLMFQTVRIERIIGVE